MCGSARLHSQHLVCDACVPVLPHAMHRMQVRAGCRAGPSAGGEAGRSSRTSEDSREANGSGSALQCALDACCPNLEARKQTGPGMNQETAYVCC